MIRRVLLVDDHTMVREGVQHLLADEFPDIETGSAATSEMALGMIAAQPWDLVLLDVSLPGRGGLEILRHVKETQPMCPVIIYTMYPEDQFGLRAMKSGADAYVTKDQPAEVLLAAVRRVSQGKKYISEPLSQALAAAIAHPSAVEPINGLSDRELQVLRMLASGKTPTAIADELHLSIKTVSTYRTRVLEKLSLNTTGELIRYAIEQRLI
ncbi:MAG TPA: response regulator transcription factor [Bryobacteraceae bacterium]|jgi:DNA-binding NarL/FixJ family response regulator